MGENELYNELCEQVEIADDEICAGVGSAAGLPVPAQLILTIVLRKLRDLSCDYRVQILEQADRFIIDRIPSATLAAVCQGALHGAVATFCGK